MINGKQFEKLRDKHCTSIIRLIKQDTLKKKHFLLVSYKKQSEFLFTRIRIENFCWNRHRNQKKKIDIVPSLIFMLLFNSILT